LVNNLLWWISTFEIFFSLLVASRSYEAISLMTWSVLRRSWTRTTGSQINAERRL